MMMVAVEAGEKDVRSTSIKNKAKKRRRREEMIYSSSAMCVFVCDLHVLDGSPKAG